ncbi:lactococcin 972 family bacteriocin [Paenibacillus barcinonensis]|uniref:Lactococcin 972 family bacteriocin n=1 Tax=Paenibacillus barcinonensis TaxID=198119 RepID=A0A2V4VEL3_PAEBA|nr:lactococcin 972 family bacteriocin [Paenibacillus barcinonensis]PYE44541.1 lactococcin 972 family bacteriocin [Paenibacillus barcinonensis]
MKKKILSLSIVAAVLLVPISHAMAQNSATSGSVDLTNVITENQLTKFTSGVVSPAVDVGGGTWDYGTSWVFPLSKKVWSNYNHQTKIHSSTASIGTQILRSGQVNAGTTSYASAIGGASEDTHAYWNVYESK